MKYHVFISYYSDNEAELAQHLYDLLESLKLKIFLDTEKMESGEQENQINVNIDESSIFMPLLSDGCFNSEWVKKEIEYALNHKDFDHIIPLWIDNYKLTEETIPESIEPLKKATAIPVQSKSIKKDLPEIQRFINNVFLKEQQSSNSNIMEQFMLSSPPLKPSTIFEGRNEKIKEIKSSLLKSQNPIVLLNGMGGIGKTTICKNIYWEYYNELENGKAKDGIEYLAWMLFEESLANSLRSSFRDLKDENDESLYIHASTKLNSYGKKLLLFIDNVNELTSDEINWVNRLRCRVIITSRSQFDEYDIFEKMTIDKLTPEASLKLYKEYGKIESDEQDDDIKAILELIDYHTLSIEIIAKTQRKLGCDASEILGELSNNITLPENEVNFDSNNNMYSHLLKVFDISKLTVEQKRIITLFSLLTPNTTIKNIKLGKWFDETDSKSKSGKIINVINELVELGWLAEGTSIHPVIADVVKVKQKPDYTTAKVLIVSLTKELEGIKDGAVQEKNVLLSHCKSLLKEVTAATEKEYADLLEKMGEVSIDTAEYEPAKKYLEKALNIYNQEKDENILSVAKCIQYIGRTYGYMGDYDKAFEYFDNARKILEVNEKAEQKDLASVYHDIGWLYDRKSNYKTSLEYYEKALKIREEVLGTEHPSTASTYNNIAGLYQAQGDYSTALEYYNKSLVIKEKVLGTEHPSTATTYNNIAGLYRA